MATADFSRIATNIGALNSLQSLNNINKQLGVHQNRLATGKRINSAADDPAGLTIATKLNARSEGLKVASDNIADAQNLLSVTESGLGRINDILVQMRNKSEQAASDTLGTQERSAIVEQMQAYSAQIDDIVEQTKWNGSKLIDGSRNTVGLRFQTGADQSDATTLDGLTNMSVGSTGLYLAAETPASSSTTQDLNGIVSAVTTGGTVTAGSAQLGGGTYSVRVDASAGTNAAVISLVDGNGNAVAFDHDLDAGAATGLTYTKDFDFSLGTTAIVDFGNGLKVDMNAIATAAVFDATISASNTGEGTYTLSSANTTSGVTSGSDASTFAAYMADIDTAMNTVSGQLSKVGALSGRLTFKADQVSMAQINVEASYNRIMNADMAYEQLESTKFSILQQTSTTMLAQANTAPQGILSLFR